MMFKQFSNTPNNLHSFFAKTGQFHLTDGRCRRATSFPKSKGKATGRDLEKQKITFHNLYRQEPIVASENFHLTSSFKGLLNVYVYCKRPLYVSPFSTAGVTTAGLYAIDTSHG